MTQQADIHAKRVPLHAWNAACRLVGDATTSPSEDDWAALVAAGVATAPGALDDRWVDLITSYLNTPSSLAVTATYAGMMYRSTLALGSLNVCVLERFTTRATDDGGIETVNRDDALEVSVTQGHPWALLRRVLPPLPTVQAPPRQTAAANAEPVRVPAQIAEWALEQSKTHSSHEVLRTLQQRSSGRLHDFFEADDASIAYAWTTESARGTSLAFAWYLASKDHLFRATFRDDPAFEEVRPGDLAFTFEWHLLGVLDALSTPAK